SCSFITGASPSACSTSGSFNGPSSRGTRARAPRPSPSDSARLRSRPASRQRYSAWTACAMPRPGAPACSSSHVASIDFRPPPGLRVLDLGCGRGEATFHAAARGAHVLAADYSPDCLTLTARTLQLAPPPVRARVQLIGADATTLPLADRSLDRALMLDVVE